MAKPRLTFQDDAQLLQNTAQRNVLLDKIKKMGGRYIQVDASYGQTHKNGAYDVANYDSLVNEARRRGMGIRMRLLPTPAYQGGDKTLSSTNPNPNLMAQYAHDMAQHFRGRVGGMSVGNEPNVYSFLGNSAITNPVIAAKVYRQMYMPTYKAIKGQAPGMKVGFGELTSGDPKAKGAYSSLGFLRAILAAGNHPIHADYFALHPYQWSNPNKKVNNPDFAGISNLQHVNEVLKEYQRKGKLTTAKGGRVPLSVSEFGYKHDAVPNEFTRGQYLHRAYQLAREANATDFNIYQLMPRAGSYWNTSIMNEKGQLSPTMKVAMARIRKGTK